MRDLKPLTFAGVLFTFLLLFSQINAVESREQNVDVIINDIESIASLPTGKEERFDSLMYDFEVWMDRIIHEDKLSECLSKIKSLKKILKKLLPNYPFVTDEYEELTEIQKNLRPIVHFTDQNPLQVLPKIRSGDRLILVDSIESGTIYFEKTFAGYTPAEIVIHQGENLIRLEYGNKSYQIKMHLKGSELFLKNALFGIPDSQIADWYGEWDSDPNGTTTLENANVDNETEVTSYNLDSNIPTIQIPGGFFVIVSRIPPPHPAFGIDKYRKLKITSDPVGADITIDNKNWGTTPKIVVIDRLVLGVNIVISKEGFISQAIHYIFNEKLMFNLNVKLFPKSQLGGKK